MFGVVDKILQGILLLGPLNTTLHILSIGKVSQPRSRCNTMDGYSRRSTDPRPNMVIRTLRRQHRCFTTELVLWPNNPIIGGWAVLFTPWKYIFLDFNVEHMYEVPSSPAFFVLLAPWEYVAWGTISFTLSFLSVHSTSKTAPKHLSRQFYLRSFRQYCGGKQSPI